MAEDESRLPAAVRRLRQVGRGAAVGALAVGLTEIVGVVAGVDRITEPVLGRPRMSGTAAVGFALAAMAILVDAPHAATGRRFARSGLGAIVAAVGAAGMLDNLFDVWPGVGMPSLPGSIALIVLGAAVLLADRSTRGGRRPADVLAAVAGFIGFVTLLGHAFGAGQLYRAADHGTALAGSLCMCLLSAAVLCARPTDGLVSVLASSMSGGTTARRLGLAAAVMVPGLGLVVAMAQHVLGFEERTSFSLVIAIAVTLSLAVVALTSFRIDRFDRELARASASEHEMRMRLEALSRASDAMSEAVARMKGSDVGPVLREIAQQARLLAGAEYAALGIASEEDPRAFAQLATAGVPESVLQALRGLAPRATGVLGDVVLRGRSVRTSRVTEHSDSRGMPAAHPPISSLLGVPLTFAGSQIGSLLLGNKRGGEEFSEDDQRMIEMLAGRAASALRAAQLYEVEARGREWLQIVIDQMPEPMLIADEDGQIVNWNRAATDARGPASAADERGAPAILDIRLPSGEPVPVAERPTALALALGEAVTGVELQLHKVDGTTRPVVASAAPLRDLDGRIRGAVALFDDITALKQLERMREEWTAVIAHDLRQPVNGLVLHAEVLRRGLRTVATTGHLESIDHIKSAGMRLNRMIEDLLDATRIEASRLKLERRAVALAPLVREILQRMPELSGHPVRLVVRGELPDVFADSVRVEQMLSNILSNAAKYGDATTAIDILVEAESSEVRVSVTNEGGELGAPALSRLFTRFYRAPSAEVGPKPGLGLGLYITKGLVEAHGGRIWVESRERRTTFHFTLPAASGAREKGARPADVVARLP